MNNNSNAWVWWLIGAIVVIVGGYLIWQHSSASMTGMAMTDTTGAAMTASSTTTNTNNDGTSAGVTVGAQAGAAMSATVTYNGSSFSPSTVTVAKGGTVTFTSTAGAMWVASDPHPEHSGYDGTTRQTHCAAGYTGATPFDQCAPGTSYSMTFNKTGTFGYHNHLVDEVRGTVIVQ